MAPPHPRRGARLQARGERQERGTRLNPCAGDPAHENSARCERSWFLCAYSLAVNGLAVSLYMDIITIYGRNPPVLTCVASPGSDHHLHLQLPERNLDLKGASELEVALFDRAIVYLF